MKKLIYVLLAVTVIWHLMVLSSSTTKIVNFFQERPLVGYAWQDNSSSDTRYFWESSHVVWQPGQRHPRMEAYADEKEGMWLSQPGYIFIKNEQDKAIGTEWQSGLQYLNLKVYSLDKEGEWGTVVGYESVNDQDGKIVDTVWKPGMRSDKFKIVAGQQQDTYDAYPGYTFVHPGTGNLDVVWTPGIQSPDNSYLVAGNTEGTWLYNQATQSTEDRVLEHSTNGITYAAAGKVAEWLFGEENPVSEGLYQEGAKEGIKAVGAAIGD